MQRGVRLLFTRYLAAAYEPASARDCFYRRECRGSMCGRTSQADLSAVVGDRGDVAQSLEDPFVSFGIERGVIRKIEQLWNRTPSLFLAQHARLRQSARGTLPNHR